MELFLDVLEKSSLEDNEQMVMTSILTCFMHMLGTITSHFDRATQAARQIEKDEELKESLIKYAIGTGTISEKTYQREMAEPIEDFKKMADCLLHISDDGEENYLAKMFEIRNAAGKRLADKDNFVAH